LTSAAEKGRALLAQALATMRFRVRPETFTVVGLPRSGVAAARAAVAGAGPDDVAQLTVEPDVITVVAREGLADSLAREPGARVERGWRVVTFDTPMVFDVVGFLAKATGVLADAGVPLCAICGFDRDHLFLRAEHLEAARAALRAHLCPEADAGS